MGAGRREEDAEVEEDGSTTSEGAKPQRRMIFFFCADMWSFNMAPSDAGMARSELAERIADVLRTFPRIARRRLSWAARPLAATAERSSLSACRSARSRAGKRLMRSSRTDIVADFVILERACGRFDEAMNP